MGRRSGKVRAPGMGWRKFAASAGGVMVLVTVSQMILPALTLEYETVQLLCSQDVHSHTEDCYDERGNAVCGYADFVVHGHTADCYARDGGLVCPLPEIKTHAHGTDCFAQPFLVCGLEEGELDGGGDASDPAQAAPVPAQPPEAEPYGSEDGSPDSVFAFPVVQQGHVHTQACWSEPELLCGREEISLHIHGAECESDGVLICGTPEVREYLIYLKKTR